MKTPRLSVRSLEPGAENFPFAGPWQRRDLLRVGALGLAASVAGGRAEQSAAAVEPAPGATAQRVIFLWMAGGVTHHDSLDPKPDAPEEIRGTLSPIATRLPGVSFAETCPQLAQCTDLFALVRSYSHDNSDHFISQGRGLSGRLLVTQEQIFTEPNLGSIVARLHGPGKELPGYIAVPGWTRPGPPPTNLFVGGWLGPQYAPFAAGGEPEQPDFTVEPLRWKNPPPEYAEDIRPRALELLSGLDYQRLEARADLRQVLDGSLRRVEAQGQPQAVDNQYRSALELLASSTVRAAFDLSSEPDSLRERYGRTKIGGRCLLARRLVEAGARFVMVDYGYDLDYGNLWDNHAVPEQYQPHICELAKKPWHVAGIDRAFAGLLTDLSERGLLDSTLVVFMTEFGRTPKINSNGGRDHWGPAGSIFFAGGGVRGGQMIGATDQQGAFPTSRPWAPWDVAATIYRALGISPETILHDQQGRPMAVLPVGQPIDGVLA